jgi:predicted transcriptional regulator of viral defense system
MRYLRDYIQNSLTDGRYFFTRSEALSILGLSSEQFRFQAYRLMSKNAIRSLTRDSFMIVPAEYHHLGGVPPHWIIDPLMKHLKQDYYIGLLSAASMYGATHQQPMSFQVVTNKAHRPISLERGLVEFYVFKECVFVIKEQLSSPAGYAKISSKEQTILDLIRFYQSCGYLSNICAVIRNIAPSCDKGAFMAAVRNEKNNSVLQRLGFVFHYMEFEVLANMVKKELSSRNIQFILLRPDVKSREGERNQSFKIIINDSIEIEE